MSAYAQTIGANGGLAFDQYQNSLAEKLNGV